MRDYLVSKGRGFCPPEWMEIYLMREMNLKPRDFGQKGPITVGQMLSWMAALAGEGDYQEIEEAKRKLSQMPMQTWPQGGR